MRVFLLDLWLDLREKRLAPIAILLLAGIIAVPVALSKSEKQVTPPPATTTPTAQAGPVIASQAQAGPVASKLQTFSARDPFEPNGSVTTATTGTTGTSGGGTGTSTGTSNAGTTGGGGGGAPVTNTPSTTGPGGTTGTGNTTGETKTTLFTYTVDVRFGPGGSVKAYKGVKRLELLPSQENPKLVFLGVTTTGKTAVFLVDSNLGVDTAGGKCRPSPDNCTFLYLRPDADHSEAVLTDTDGTAYHLHLLDINRVTLSSANGKTTTGTNGNSNSNGNTNSKRSPAFTGSVDPGSSGADSTTPPGEAPPGEPASRSSFQQFFADGASH